MTQLLNKSIVDKLKLHAIKVLQTEYLRPDIDQPLWVTYKKYEEWQCSKDKFLANNCLPAHLAILPEVKKIAPDAIVVIGILHETDKNLFKEIINHIESFDPINTSEPDKYFHAWIKLNLKPSCCAILDIISDVAQTSTNGYLDLPLEKGHIEILTTKESVYDFHAKYIKNRFNMSRANGTADSNSKAFLKRFSEQQGISITDAFGSLNYQTT
jgi:hypothetical protein